MRIIGLTGGIGSGKSTVAKILGELGAAVYDLDKIGHEILRKNGSVYKQVLSAFGEEILGDDKEIDRAKLGKIVFNNHNALDKLNKIVHPGIDKKVEELTNECRRKKAKVLIMEAAAMLENDRSWQSDELWVVIAGEAVVIQRTKNRPGYDEEVVKSRIRSQMKNEDRIKKADVVIENNGTAEELKAKVKAEWEKLLKRL